MISTSSNSTSLVGIVIFSVTFQWNFYRILESQTTPCQSFGGLDIYQSLVRPIASELYLQKIPIRNTSSVQGVFEQAHWFSLYSHGQPLTSGRGNLCNLSLCTLWSPLPKSFQEWLVYRKCNIRVGNIIQCRVRGELTSTDRCDHCTCVLSYWGLEA